MDIYITLGPCKFSLGPENTNVLRFAGKQDFSEQDKKKIIKKFLGLRSSLLSSETPKTNIEIGKYIRIHFRSNLAGCLRISGCPTSCKNT